MAQAKEYVETASDKRKREAAIEQLAQDILGLETLEARNRDQLDFHELSVWNLKEALSAAYSAGRHSGEK